jgi:hypothetical protein
MHAAIRVTSQLANPPVSKSSHSLFPIHESAGREIRHRTIDLAINSTILSIVHVCYYACGVVRNTANFSAGNEYETLLEFDDMIGIDRSRLRDP